jgi:hypothetical protein
LNTEAEQPTILFEDGPRDGDRDTADFLPVVIGTGAEGGVYQRTDEERDGLAVYRWQRLDKAAADAIVRGDIRANQGPDR